MHTMERNNTDEVRQVTVRLPRELVDRVDAEARRRCVGRPLLLAAALERFLEASPEPIGIPHAPVRVLGERAS
jgi:hypothetical protein